MEMEKKENKKKSKNKIIIICLIIMFVIGFLGVNAYQEFMEVLDHDCCVEEINEEVETEMIE